jgi:hypothetical protein
VAVNNLDQLTNTTDEPHPLRRTKLVELSGDARNYRRLMDAENVVGARRWSVMVAAE